MARYDFFYEASQILSESDASVSLSQARAIMEDTNSPIARQHIDNLYKQIVGKTHIDFDDIPQSRGNIKVYKGYESMVETLNIFQSLSTAENVKDPMDAVQVVVDAVANIASLADMYQKGFETKNDYIMMEYNLMVYCCVEATSSLLSQYVDFVKGFDLETFQVKMKNTKYRANLLFVENLKKFNNIVVSSNYRNYLASMLNNDRSNFVGTSMMIGVAAVAATVLIGIVPVTRSIAYCIYRTRTKLSDALALQAYFLELNKACVEANKEFSKEKKEKILKKQSAVRNLFLKLSDKLKVDIARAERDALSALKNDNAPLTVSNTKKDVDSSGYDDFL